MSIFTGFCLNIYSAKSDLFIFYDRPDAFLLFKVLVDEKF